MKPACFKPEPSSPPAAAGWLRLQQLNQELLAAPSATAVLTRWCGAGAEIRVRKQSSRRLSPPPPLLAQLALRADESLDYRRVALQWAGQTLSEADNWYCPQRLTPQMQQALVESDQPFGQVVRALGFIRETLQVEWLWQPKPGMPVRLPWALLRHQAILRKPQGEPFSAVIETYTRPVLTIESSMTA